MKIALHWKIIIGMLLGIIWGIISINWGLNEITNFYIKPFGTIFIKLLKLIAVPLIFASLITGVCNLSNISKLSNIGIKTIFFYILSTVIAVLIGLILVNIIKPGKSFPQEKRILLKEKYATDVENKENIAKDVKKEGPLRFLLDIVPQNIIKASSSNNNMLQVIFFSIIFGISIIMLPENTTKTVKSFFKELNEIILKLVDIIMKFAPYGVFALLAGILVDITGNDPKGILEILTALTIYSLTVLSGLLIMIMFIYPLFIKFFTSIKYKDFFKGILPAQILAFSTSSSAATLPVTMERCERNLGLSEETTSFVLPLGATINMDGTSLYQAVAAVFIAQAFAIDLTIGQQLTIILTSTLASIGAAAVPGAGTVMLVIVLSAIGIDPKGIGLIFAVDRILDMCRTVVNVTGDATVASIIDSKKNK